VFDVAVDADDDEDDEDEDEDEVELSAVAGAVAAAAVGTLSVQPVRMRFGSVKRSPPVSRRFLLRLKIVQYLSPDPRVRAAIANSVSPPATV